MHGLRLIRALHSSRASRAPPVKSTSALFSAPDGLFTRLAAQPASRVAVTHNGRSQTYAELSADSARVAALLRTQRFPPSFDAPPRIGILHRPCHAWLHALLGIWRAGLVAVPLSPSYPARALAPLLSDSAVSCVLSEPALSSSVPVGVPVLRTDTAGAGTAECIALKSEEHDPRMLLYTSGTTSAPKGVLWTEKMLRFQLNTLTQMWRWSAADRALCVLPLHHVHGIVNVTLSALYSGAEVEFHDRFCADKVWKSVCGPRSPTVFMAVPTVYARLIEKYRSVGEDEKEEMRNAARRVRLFVCGSAVLPRQRFKEWEEISGQRLLERYGMTETGMLLSNEYEQRYCGTVGKPLPGVETRVGDGGELWVRGPGVFAQYWRKKEATKKAFDAEGWFRTGDVVEFDESRGVFQMVGRLSIDIIKSGGYKVSALEIEGAMRDVDGVGDVAVVGVPHVQLGEGIVAIVVLREGEVETDVREKVLSQLRDVLPRYKIPRGVHFVGDFPRNEMGKVKKNVLKKEWGDWYSENGWEDTVAGG